MVEPHSLFAHILAQTKENVQLLITHGQISEADGEEILFRLSARHAVDSSVVSLTEKTERLNISPAPPKMEARTIWGWSSEDPNDLSFEAGEIIEIVTETNADWWTGRNRSGKQGIFPSNYVERLPPRNVSPILVPEPRKSMVSSGPAEQRFSSPALPHPQPYPAAPQAYYPPPGPPPGTINYAYVPPAGPPTPQPVPQQAPAKKSKFGGLGQMMAQSAASGAGFGAGAAVGSGIVNSIF